MNYFDKIEAYTTGTLSEVDCLAFEGELAGNLTLQQEVEGYQLAQSLFDFAGEQLSEAEIITADAASLADALFDFTANNLSEAQILGIDTTTAVESTELADLLINFTASNLSEAQILGIDTTTVVESTELADSLINFTASNLSEAQILGIDTTTTVESTELADSLINFTASNLSEAQILATTSIGAKAPIIRSLQPRTNRTAWLAAASMLFILSLIGSQFYTSQNLGQDSMMVAETPVLIEKARIKAIPTNDRLVEALAVNIPKKEIKKYYPPAKVKVITAAIVTNPLAAANEVDNELKTVKKVLGNPIAMNTVAEEIKASSVISAGQSIEYNATGSITLEAGFSVEPGTNFTAKTAQIAATDELNSNSTISKKESVNLKAKTSITLKPGFHAKVGASFKAEIGK